MDEFEFLDDTVVYNLTRDLDLIIMYRYQLVKYMSLTTYA